MTPILEMRGIHKRFPGVHAMRNVSFSVKKGSVHGVIGENGAGSHGASVLMVSSELPEILGRCHRIIVMREGAIAAVLDGAAATEEAIMARAVWN